MLSVCVVEEAEISGFVTKHNTNIYSDSFFTTDCLKSIINKYQPEANV